MRTLLLVLVLVCLAVEPVAHAAGGAVQRLTDFQRQVKAFGADFTQRVTDDRGAVIQESSGTVLLARPLRFRWDYAAPFEQAIVSNGKRVWFFDADLEQVTVKPVKAVVSGGAAALLSSADDLGERFRLQAEPDAFGLAWVSAVPREADSNIERIRVGFRGRDPAVMELRDSLGQVTRLDFSRLVRNPDIPAEAFRFVPPPGADVLYSEGG